MVAQHLPETLVNPQTPGPLSAQPPKKPKHIVYLYVWPFPFGRETMAKQFINLQWLWARFDLQSWFFLTVLHCFLFKSRSAPLPYIASVANVLWRPQGPRKSQSPWLRLWAQTLRAPGRPKTLATLSKGAPRSMNKKYGEHVGETMVLPHKLLNIVLSPTMNVSLPRQGGVR